MDKTYLEQVKELGQLPWYVEYRIFQEKDRAHSATLNVSSFDSDKRAAIQMMCDTFDICAGIDDENNNVLRVDSHNVNNHEASWLASIVDLVQNPLTEELAKDVIARSKWLTDEDGVFMNPDQELRNFPSAKIQMALEVLSIQYKEGYSQYTGDNGTIIEHANGIAQVKALREARRAERSNNKTSVEEKPSAEGADVTTEFKKALDPVVAIGGATWKGNAYSYRKSAGGASPCFYVELDALTKPQQSNLEESLKAESISYQFMTKSLNEIAEGSSKTPHALVVHDYDMPKVDKFYREYQQR